MIAVYYRMTDNVGSATRKGRFTHNHSTNNVGFVMLILVFFVLCVAAFVLLVYLFGHGTFNNKCLIDNYAYLCDDNISQFETIRHGGLLGGNPIIICSRLKNNDYRHTGLADSKMYYPIYLTKEEIEVCKR